ncbi:protein lifeguard 1-like [Centropristis striata]|uniref:protein lifeguard 1-like n=1 Tax=Centropristis striata TaxID=184440 RepID=UPI0027E1CC66|nr:protein lifeguard 1-like [Centropristis striata]
MSYTADCRTSKGTQDTPGYDVSSQPPSYEEQQPLSYSSFDDKTVRRAFVRKVFSILTFKLLFTVSVLCVFTFSRGEAEQTNMCAFLISIILFIAVTITLSCCKSFNQRHPWNTMGLVVVTLSLSYVVGTIASFHDTTDIIITMGATLIISFAIIAFSAETYDFNIWYGVLLILTVDLTMFGSLHLLLLRYQ